MSNQSKHHASGRSSLSRRDFLHVTALASVAATVTGCDKVAETTMRPPPVITKSPERIRVGVIGCGWRGRGAAWDAVQAAENVQIVALGDLFPDRVEEARNWLVETAGKANRADSVQITPERCFSGFDNFKGVLGCDLEMVVLAAPPGFRPPHYAAAIEAGKHVFMEKPVAVDPVGFRQVVAASELAQQRGLAVVAGTQRRHQPHYLEALRRIHDGQIGEVRGAQCYWNQGELWVKKQEPNWSDMEWQCRNWLYFTWLSGDHIVEQHVHNLDVVNWAMQATPVKCVGMGGRAARTAPEFGHIYDHFAVEYEYPNGVRTLSMCRQVKGSSDRVAEVIVGTHGVAHLNSNTAKITGRRNWEFDDGGNAVNPYVQEHTDLIASIRAGRPLNEGRQVAESTLTAIMGRMSAYTGRELQWSWLQSASELNLMPAKLEMGPLSAGEVAIPGVTKLV